MSKIPGSIPVTGFIGPTDSEDTYAVTDALYGVDGYRSVSGLTVRNSITLERRREGMLVYTQDDKNVWQLNPEPWSGISQDWKLFISSAATSTLTGSTGGGNFLSVGGGVVTGDTVFTTNVSANTIHLSSTSISSLNTNIFLVDPSPLNNGDMWVSSGISGVFLNIRVGGITKSVEFS